MFDAIREEKEENSEKASSNKTRQCTNFVSNFNLGNRLIIPFKFGTLSPKMLGMNSQIINKYF
jgi:hypothetical protein